MSSMIAANCPCKDFEARHFNDETRILQF